MPTPPAVAKTGQSAGEPWPGGQHPRVPRLHLAILVVLAQALAAVDDDERLLLSARQDPAATISTLISLSARVRELPLPAAASLADRIDPLARRLFLEGWRLPGRDRAGLEDLVIRAGDSLDKLARQRHSTVDLMLRLNPGIDPRRLRLGDHLTALDTASVPLRLEVVLSTRRLLLWRGPLLVLCSKVGIGGAGTPTPTGVTTLANRVKNPEWRDPATGKVFPPHSPGNLLGGWWFGFAPGTDNRFRSIGCHGWTGNDPDQWLERESSRGCIRMRQEDITDLGALAVSGIAVEVR